MKKIKKVVIAAMGILSIGLFVGCGSETITSEVKNDEDITYSQDFKLRNGTGKDIIDLYISPAGEEKWDDDLLDGSTLKTGYTVNVDFKSQEEAKKWDIKILNKNDEEIEWKDVNLSDGNRITLQNNSEDAVVSYK